LEQTAATYLERADQLSNEGDLRAAVACLQGYLQLKPDDSTVRSRLAELYDESASTSEEQHRAVDLYFRALGCVRCEECSAVAMHSEESHLRLRLGKLLLEMGDYSVAKANADRLLEVAERNLAADPHSKQSCDLRSQAVRMRALAIYAQYRSGAWKNDDDEKRSLGEVVEDALRVNPGDRALISILAEIYRDVPQWLPDARIAPNSEERNRCADKLMESLAQAHPRDGESLLAVYEYQVKHDLPAASTTLEAAFKAAPRNAAVLSAKARAERVAAQSASANGQGPDIKTHLESALVFCRQILEAKPDDETATADAAEILLQLGNSDAAIQTCAVGLKTNPNSIRLNLLAAQTQLERGRPDEVARQNRFSGNEGPLERAERLLAPFAIVANRRNSPEMRQSLADLREHAALLRGRWHFERGDVRASLSILEQSARGANTEIARTAHSLLADIYWRMTQPDQAAKHYEALADRNPQDLAARRAAANAWETMGCLNAAEKHLRRTLEKKDSASDRISLARVLFRRGQQERQPDRRLEAFDDAIKLAREAKVESDSSLSWQRESLVILASYMRQSEPIASAAWRERALLEFRDQESRCPLSPASLTELAWDYELLKASADANRVAERLVERRAQDADGYLLQAQLANKHGDAAGARAAIAKGISAVVAEQKTRFERELVEFDLAENRRKDAEKRLQSLFSELPSAKNVLLDGALLNLALDVAERAAIERDDKSAEHWETLLWNAEGPDGSLWRFVRARRLLESVEANDDPRFAEAGRLQHEISRIRPSWPLGYLLGGMLLERRGMLNEAADAYQAAASLGCRRPAVDESPAAVFARQGRCEGDKTCSAAMDDRMEGFPGSAAASPKQWLNTAGSARRSAGARLDDGARHHSDPHERPLMEN
jgi:predicted Zn-dependent protease